jgi:hypothetical protein
MSPSPYRHSEPRRLGVTKFSGERVSPVLMRHGVLSRAVTGRFTCKCRKFLWYRPGSASAGFG